MPLPRPLRLPGAAAGRAVTVPAATVPAGTASAATVRTAVVRTAVVRAAVVLAVLATTAVAWAPGASATGVPAAVDVSSSDFRHAMGYTPVAAPGRPSVLLRPDGDCSTPTGGTRFGFDQACSEHDLAYDVLRYQDGRGDVIGPQERWSADARFGVRMTQRCAELAAPETAGCLATAALYTTAVTLNSVRQLYGPPVEESGLGIAASSLAMVAVFVLLLAPTAAARTFRRMLRRAELDLVAPPSWSGWSGADGSLVRWADLGREGRRLLTRPPVAPGALRVVVGLESARRLRDRVDLALAEAERVGAFTRGTVCVATPTGSGWLNPGAVEALERATGGDVATITVPYAAAPSWLSAVAHPGAHRRASVALLRAVHERRAELETARRPRLVVLGESLGANGMAAALRTLPQVAAEVSGGLLVGAIRSAWWEPLGRVDLVRHDDDPVVRLGARTLRHLPGAGQAPEGTGHHYGAELDAAWAANLAGTTRAPRSGSVSVPVHGSASSRRFAPGPVSAAHLEADLAAPRLIDHVQVGH